MIRNLPLNAKLTAAVLGLVILTVVVLTSVNLIQTQRTLTDVAMTSIKALGDSIYRDFEAQNAVTVEKVAADLVLLEREIGRNGLLNFDDYDIRAVTITNQVTQATETVDLPVFQAGRTPLDNPRLVDEVVDLVGGTATIFQYLPGKMIRISTTVRRADGERATLTYIPEDSPVYKAVTEGRVYTGRAFVVNAWYLTAYAPMKSIHGDLLGMAYIGRPIMTDAVRHALSGANINGKGFAFAFDAKGAILEYPDDSKIGRNISEVGLPKEAMEITEGFVTYVEDGKPTTAYVRYFPEWDWRLAMSIRDADMLQGADMRMLRSGAVAAVVMLAVGGLLTLLIIRLTTSPLKRLENYTAEVASGNFAASIDYAAKDAIGRTVDGVRAMVGEIKNKLGFAQGVLDGVSFSSPCLITDASDKVTFVNQRLLDLLQKPGRPDDYKGQTIGEFLFGDPSRGKRTMAEVRAKKHAVSEMQYDCGRSVCKTMTANTSMIHDLDGKELGAFTLYFDLTQIRQQETLLTKKNEQIASIAQQAGLIADQVSSAAEELAAQVEQATRGADLQSSRAAETATAMEEMNATVLEVARNASEAAGGAEQARNKARQGEESVRQVMASIAEVARQADQMERDMGELGRQADGIGNIIGVINDIADQTNLLALNAAIEAARAGDAGRGFAVVADEVRKLAEKTMAATKEVGSAIAAIQAGTQKSVAATKASASSVGQSTNLAQESGKALTEIVGIVESTAGQVSSIATAAEQQSATSEEISRAIEDITRVSGETAAGMNQSSQAIAELARRAHELQRLIEEMKA